VFLPRAIDANVKRRFSMAKKAKKAEKKAPKKGK